jgi:hypothetical protein
VPPPPPTHTLVSSRPFLPEPCFKTGESSPSIAAPWSVRTDVPFFSAGSSGFHPRGERRGPASGVHGSFIPAKDLAARNRASVGRNARWGTDLVWGGRRPRLGVSAETTRAHPTGFRPQQAPSPPGVISTPTLCSDGYLSASHARLGPILCPCAMTGPRAVRGRRTGT